MKIGILTTLNINRGDDFIKEGIIYLFKNYFKREKLEFIIINKHNPYSLFGIEMYGKNKFIRKVVNKLVKIKPEVFYKLFKLGKVESVFDDCNLMIQSGAPVIWANEETGNNSLKSDWTYAFWKDVAPRVRKLGIPIFNLSIGSCLKYGSKGEEVYKNEKLIEFIKKDILENSDVITFRDDLTKDISKNLGKEGESIVCSSIFSSDNLGVKKKEGEYIIINYMEGGGHFHSWDKRIYIDLWDSVLKNLIKKLSKEYEIKFLCHSQKEVKEAKEMFPEYKSYIFKDTKEQMEFMSKTIACVNNRVHATMGFASLGIPSITITTDSRVGLIDKIGLPTYFSGDRNLSSDELYLVLKELIKNKEKFGKGIKEIKKITKEEYFNEFSKYYKNERNN